MKLQDVILRAIAKKITWLDAAEIAGLSVQAIGRLRKQYEKFGYDGLFDQQRRKRHLYRVPLSTTEKVLSLYQDSYCGLTAQQFRRKLCSDHGIRLSYCWVSQALVGAGLIAVPKKPPNALRA
jgi:transposase